MALTELVAGPLTPEAYPAAIAATLGVPLEFATFVATSVYPLGVYASPSLALGAVGTDAIFACSSRSSIRALSHHVPVFAYEFNDENAPQNFLPPVSFPYGASHGSEIQYMFDIGREFRAPPLDAEQRQLAEAMVTYWTNFAKTGDPNEDGVPAWPAYDAASDVFQSLVPPVPAPETGFADDHKCWFWTPE